MPVNRMAIAASPRPSKSSLRAAFILSLCSGGKIPAPVEGPGLVVLEAARDGSLPAASRLQWLLVAVGALENHAAVGGAAFLGLVACDWLGLAQADGGKPGADDAGIIQVLLDGIGTPLGELLVVGLGAAAVGVSFDHATHLRQRFQDRYELIEQGLVLGGELGGVEAKAQRERVVAAAAIGVDAHSDRGGRAAVEGVGHAVAVR